jgi:hypothetical protein
VPARSSAAPTRLQPIETFLQSFKATASLSKNDFDDIESSPNQKFGESLEVHIKQLPPSLYIVEDLY